MAPLWLGWSTGWKQDPREQQEPRSQSQSVTGLGTSRIQHPAEPPVLAEDQKANASRDPNPGRQGLGGGRAAWRAAGQGDLTRWSLQAGPVQETGLGRLWSSLRRGLHSCPFSLACCSCNHPSLGFLRSRPPTNKSAGTGTTGTWPCNGGASLNPRGRL